MVYTHLGPYSDWPATNPAIAARQTPPPRGETLRHVRELLAVTDEAPVDVRVEQRWQHDDIDGEELSWSVGFGPRTRARLLKPAGTDGPLPGVVALHSHDGFKYHGLDKVADGLEATPPSLSTIRSRQYGDRAFANHLARQGFVVLAPDVFCWGSRRFPLDVPADDIDAYNAAARDHEHLVEKYCTLLGTTFAAVVSREDRLALHYLRSRPDVTDRIGCVGLSGGGCRAALLQATSDVSASVIVGMMSTYDALLDRHVASHTWMFFPAGLPAVADWSDLAACRAPSPLMVQYNRQDDLFSIEGAEAAHQRIAGHYADAPDAYVGAFYDGHHKFDVPMQEDAFGWLSARLS